MFFVLIATILGGYIRFFPALITGFPINDGGLFYRNCLPILPDFR